MQVTKRALAKGTSGGTQMIRAAPLSVKSQSPLNSILGSILQHLRAATVAAYVTGAADKEWLLADYAGADAELDRPAERVQLQPGLADRLRSASTPINGHGLPYHLFFTRNDARETRRYSCAWAPVRWDGTLAGGLAVASSNGRDFSAHELNHLSTMTRRLARRLRIHQLITRYRVWGDRAARDQLILMHLGLVDRVCRRFAGKDAPIEDLHQVGAMALLTAVDRYRPDRGHDFEVFATPCIVGELMNYFRDNNSLLKVSRSLRQLRIRIQRRTQYLAQQMGRFPTIDEIAAGLEAPRQIVIEALQLGRNGRPLSMEAELDDESALKIADLLAEEDPDLERLCDRITVRDAIARLDEVDKAIILQRFYEGRTQAEIAERLGISQVHVSRLQRSALLKVKMMLADGWV